MRILLFLLAVLPIAASAASSLPEINTTTAPRRIVAAAKAGGRTVTVTLKGSESAPPASLVWLSKYEVVAAEEFTEGNPVETLSDVMLPPNVWVMVALFQGDGKYFYVIHDGIDTSKEVNFAFDVAEATHNVDFALVMPDGMAPDFALWKKVDGQEVQVKDGNIYGADLCTSICNVNFKNLTLAQIWGFAGSFKDGSNPDEFVDAFNIVTNKLSDDYYYIQNWNAVCPDYTLVAALEARPGDSGPATNSTDDYRTVNVEEKPSALAAEFTRYPASFLFETIEGRMIGFRGPVNVRFKPSLRLLDATLRRSDFWVGYSVNELADEGTLYQLNNFYRMIKLTGESASPGLFNMAGLDIPFCGPWCTPPGGEWTGESWLRFNPVGEIAADETIVYGNDCPIAVMTPRFPEGKRYTPSVGLSYIGRQGDYRGTDLYFADITLEKEGEVKASGFTGLYTWCDTHGKELRDGVWTLRAENRNVAVDDIEGSNTSEFIFGNEGQFPPELQMLQMRDAAGRITDRIESADGARLEIAGGLFDYHYGSTGSWFTLSDEEPRIIVEYAPAGSDNFRALTLTREPDKDYMPGYGLFYSAGLGQVTSTGWHDLRVTMSDACGNSAVQTLRPAMWIGKAGSIAVTAADVAADDDGECYDLAGRRVCGQLAPGIYVKPGRLVIVK